MSRLTLYRADVDSARLERILGKVPGVAVADGETDDEPTDETVAPDESEDGGGLRERIPVPETDIDAEPASLVKRYGLLGLGVSLVMLGVATVGIWLYRRRSGDDEVETPPPATEFGTTVTDETPTSGTTSPTTGTEPSTAGAESPGADPSIVRPEAASDEEPEADAASDVESDAASDVESDAASETEPEEATERGRTEGDRSDVEWTTRERSGDGTDEASVDDEQADDESADEVTRPTDSVDAAPLLGAAFLAATGVVVRWLQGGDEGPTA